MHLSIKKLKSFENDNNFCNFPIPTEFWFNSQFIWLVQLRKLEKSQQKPKYLLFPISWKLEDFFEKSFFSHNFKFLYTGAN